MHPHRSLVTMALAGAWLFAHSAPVHAEEFMGEEAQINALFINEMGQVCATITNLTPGPIAIDVVYTRAPQLTLLAGFTGTVMVLEGQCEGEVVIGGGATSDPVCFTPSESGAFCNGFSISEVDVPCGSGEEIACRAQSGLLIPAPEADGSDRGAMTNSATVTVGDSAPPGATSIQVTIVPVSVPAGYSISVPSSIPIPAPGTSSTFDIEVTFPPGVGPGAEWTVQFEFDHVSSFFAETHVRALATGASIPTVSEWSLIALGGLLVGGSVFVMRRGAGT